MNVNPESSVSSKIKEAGRHSIVYGLGSVAQSAVGFVLLPILTGALTKEDFGVYSLILMASAVAGAIFYLGMTSALPRSYFDYQSADDRRAVFTTAFVILLGGALIQSGVGYFGGQLISKALVGRNNYSIPIAWAFLGSAIGFVNQYFFSYLRILRKSTASVIFSLIGLPGGIGLTLWLLARSPGDLAAPFEALAWSQLAIMLIFIGFFGKEAFTFRIQKEELSRLIPFGVGSVVASFGGILLDWADRLIIEHFLTLADVGSYSAAFRIGTLINIILISPFSQIWSPMMMEYRTHDNIKELFTKVFYYFMMIGTVTLAGASLFMGDILPLLIRSEISHQMISVILLVMLGTLIYGCTNIVAAGLLYERKVAQVSYVYYTVAGIKIGVNLLIIPVFGIVGAAVTTLLASVMIPTGIYALARKYFSFIIDWKRLALLGFNLLLPLVYGLFYFSEYPIALPLRIIWFFVFCILIYFTCFSSDEKVQLKNVVLQFVPS
ncbi:polysaccharide biosynthesis protein [Rhodoferax ferrireducens T118]|uniref:Polysaccharide biosynthesis protein n=1 Tax=Albidiferax ferrireducens (strain ATCC BAA-621 / DSM 15236 / T118) TaxID=338969 RepID=Q21Z29_ALBFT|nr:oligosaccharide flippase family protein [Rhodoferax ferrireducens]ABD68974.1 polysaccharide biosynthesis protein [Rhodoferax ferrireducens T118]